MVSQSNKIFVVGATGFIGSRLVEKLVLYYEQSPLCLVRDFSKLSKISRFKVDIVGGDVLNVKDFEEDVKVCDVYIVSVHGKETEQEHNWLVNTQGTKNLLDLAVNNNVKHFVFLSTTAIYEENHRKGTFLEDSIPVCNKKDYAGGKLEAEKLCLEYSERYDLNITILRPTIVYGPFAPTFTMYPAALIKRGVLKNYGFFNGVCNPVYIEDVVDVIIECVLNDKTYNEIFNISSGETLSWLEFFNYYANIINGYNIPRNSYSQYLLRSLPVGIVKRGAKSALKMAPGLTKLIYQRIKSHGSGDWSWVQGEDITTLNPEMYKKELIFPVGKMKTVLGYQPKYDIQNGMEVTGRWLKYANLV